MTEDCVIIVLEEKFLLRHRCREGYDYSVNSGFKCNGCKMEVSKESQDLALLLGAHVLDIES